MPATAAAIDRSSFRISALLLIAFTAYAVGCTPQFPTTKVTPIKAANPADLQHYLLSRKPDVAQFRFRGPFAMVERRDLEIPLDSNLTVEADLYLCAAASKAPLVIVLHGNNNSKEDHAFQAMHLASWGMHGLALYLPKGGPWIANGKTLAKLVDTIHRDAAAHRRPYSTRTRSFSSATHSAALPSPPRWGRRPRAGRCSLIPPPSVEDCRSCSSESPFQ